MRITIRTTTLLILACSFGTALLAAILISNTVLFPEFRRIGESQAQTNLQRATDAVENASAQLHALTRDWAWWDDTYAFVENRNKGFVSSNLVASTFDDLELRTIAFFSPEGQIVWGKSMPEDGALMQVQWALETFMRDWALFAYRNRTPGFHGLKRLGGKLYLVACEQILTSEKEGPSRGWLFMSRPVDAEWIQDLSNLTHLDISIQSPSEALPPHGSSIRQEDGWFITKEALKGVENSTAAIITVRTRDEVTQTGFRVILTSLALMLGAIICLGIIAYHLFRIRVADRVWHMRDRLRMIAQAPEQGYFVETEGTDELADLAEDINAVLKEMRDHEQFLQNFIDSIQVGVVMVSADTRRVVKVNQPALKMLGKEQEAVIGQPCHRLICPENKGDCPILDHGKSVELKRCEIVNAVNARVPVLKSVTPIDRRGVKYLVESFVSIEELERTRLELEESEALYRTVFMNTGTATILMDKNGVIRKANSEFITLSGAPAEAVFNAETHWTDFFHPDDSNKMRNYHDQRRDGHKSVPRNYESRFITTNGDVRDVNMTVAMVPGTELSVASILDITERKKVEKELEFKAFYDKITELPNRLYFTDALNRTVNRSLHEGSGACVIQLDLDEFKTVNDSFGHDTGDKLLFDIGQRLLAALDGRGMLARLGGDEFGIIIERMNDPEEIPGIAQRLMTCFASPFYVDNSEIYLGGSIGVAAYPQDGTNAQDLIRSADLAMYRSKDIGKNTYSIFSQDMNRRSRSRLETESALRRALEDNELEPWYQPKVNIASGAITGMEALIRWRKKDGTIVPPGKFIPLAEESGLIRSLDLHVLEQACRDAKAWLETTGTTRPVSVNLSARHFLREGLTERVELILNDVGLPPNLLDLELTETTLMENFDAAVHAMTRLTDLGATFSLDDFGTGYSSLYYLKRLPFSTVKIDRSFVSMIQEEADSGQALVRTILRMAEELGLNVIAEGVETAEQLHFLRQERCAAVQGYFFSPPLPKEDFEALLQRGYFELPSN